MVEKGEKESFKNRLKKDVKRTRRETDEEYLRRVIGEKKAKKPLKIIELSYLDMDIDSDKITTHEDSERY